MKTKKFSAMILSAGYGTRLRPLTHKIPKPLIKIGNINLLENIINLLLENNCKEIIVNSHYKHKMIKNFFNKKKYNIKKITLSYEKEILDTGGALKKAKKNFTNDNVLVINSDIFLKKENFKDIGNLISNYRSSQKCRLLLVPKKKAFGINKKKGDFIKIKNLLKRYKDQKKIFYYSGIQIISLNLLKNYKMKKFSFNVVWDDLIKNNSLYGNIMQSKLYHVGDIEGLKKAKNL